MPQKDSASGFPGSFRICLLAFGVYRRLEEALRSIKREITIFAFRCAPLTATPNCIKAGFFKKIGVRSAQGREIGTRNADEGREEKSVVCRRCI
jgi:hypothetical protein